MNERLSLKTRGYSPELDGLRGVAIGLVLIVHYLPNITKVSPDSSWWWPLRVLSACWSGVDLFFVLSGYLIGGILEDNRDAMNYFRVFYWRRACRILPIYFLTLVGVVVIPSVFQERVRDTMLLVDPLPFWSYLFFVQNLVMAVQGQFGGWIVTWSLAVEEQFYVFLPLVVRFGRGWLIAVLSGGCLAAPFFRLMLPNPVAAYVLPIARADSLFLGVLLALLMRERPVAAVKLGSFPGLVPILLGGCFTIALIEPSFDKEPMRSLGTSLFALTYAAILLRSQVTQGGATNRILRIKFLGWLGRRAYFVYLTHFTVLVVVHGLVSKQDPRNRTPEDFAVTVLALAVTLLAAEVSWRLIEAPAIRAGHRVAYSFAKTSH